MQLITVKIDKPEAINFILGQTHFIKSVEDLHEALVGAVPGIKFGVAFCEASGKCLVRWSGTDPAMIELAQKNAKAICCRSHLHHLPGRRLLPGERAERDQDGAGSLPHLLRHGQSDRSGRCRDGTGARHPGRGGRIPAQGHRGRRAKSSGGRICCGRSAIRRDRSRFRWRRTFPGLERRLARKPP